MGVSLALTLLLELGVLRRLRFDWVVVATVLAGTVVCASYLGYTTVSERNYDGPAHVEYVQAMARELRPPEVFACGACGHPPLYYALGAVWSRAVGGLLGLEPSLQWLSLLASFGFVVVALSILRSRIEKPAVLWVATALVVFWPSSVIHSVRVHNDVLASPLMLACIYFVARWDERGDARDFWLALAAAALALFTKSSAYPVAATLLLFALLRLRSTGWSRKSLEQCAAAVLVLSAAATLPGAIRRSPEPIGVCQKVLGHACGGRYVPPVADSPGRFLSFDAGDFLRRSDTLPDDPHRDYFPNRLLKSALFGVTPLGEELESARHRALGVLIRSLLLLMIAVCVASVPLLRGAAFQRYRVYVAATVLMFSFLVAFRLRFPNPFHEDFRHIFPALVPLCLGYVKLAERLGRVHPLLGRAGHAIGLSMALSSAVFFLRLP